MIENFFFSMLLFSRGSDFFSLIPKFHNAFVPTLGHLLLNNMLIQLVILPL